MGNSLYKEDETMKQNVYDENFEVKSLMLLKKELLIELGLQTKSKDVYRSRGKGGHIPQMVI